jgi:hypothetical protein
LGIAWEIFIGKPGFFFKVFWSISDTHDMEDLDFIVETVFGHEPEEERQSAREKMLANGNPEWIKDFAKKLRRLMPEREWGKD